MALGTEESKVKYARYIDRVRKLREVLVDMGYSVDVQDDIELEATYQVLLKGIKVSRIWWNVPYYLEFETFVNQNEKSFSDDYVKNYDDWARTISSIEASHDLYRGKIQNG